MKVYIAYKTEAGPYGGANQFLKALSDCLQKRGFLAATPEAARIILFNSHHDTASALALKKRWPEKIFVQRIDGPMRLYNREFDRRDSLANAANVAIADATIFQSSWSRTQNHRLGLQEKRFETTVMNAPDPAIFNQQGKLPFDKTQKTRLIACSWSQNPRKGFDVYRQLDESLDFNFYDFTFAGRSPVTFKNIKRVPPLSSPELAAELKKNDIFITASQKDPCSNALIEAMHCGLPALALADGGHPEIVRQGGELFGRPEQIPGLLEKITADYHAYQKAIDLPNLEQTADKYSGFLQSVDADMQAESGPRKPKGVWAYLKRRQAEYRIRHSG